MDPDNFDRMVDHFEVGTTKPIQYQGKHYGFHVPAQNNVILVSKELDPKAAVYAARCVQHHPRTAQSDDNDPNIINVWWKPSENPQDEYLTVTDKTEGLVWRPMITVCHCREPHPMEEAHMLRTCTNCAERFHKDCLPRNVPQDNEEEWNCASCTVPIEGLQWGAQGIDNTCTMDNIVTAWSLKCIENPDFEKKLKRFKYPSDVLHKNNMVSKAITTTVNYAKKDDSARAQSTWNTFRISRTNPDIKKVNNMHGTPASIVYNHIKEGTALETYKSCANCDYATERRQESTIYLNPRKPLHDNIMEAISEDHMSTKCPKCKVGSCRQRPYMVDPKKPPHTIRFETDMAAYTPQEVLWAPPEIDMLGGHRYEFGLATLHRGDHFQAIIKYDNQFLSYDGNRTPHITRMSEKLKNSIEHSVADVAYFWKGKTPVNEETVSPASVSSNSDDDLMPPAPDKDKPTGRQQAETQKNTQDANKEQPTSTHSSQKTTVVMESQEPVPGSSSNEPTITTKNFARATVTKVSQKKKTQGTKGKTGTTKSSKQSKIEEIRNQCEVLIEDLGTENPFK